MSRTFQVKTIPSRWLDENGRRLDCGPYMSGAFEAKIILKNLKYPKQSLKELTLGGMDGIFKGKMIKRIFVDNDNHSVPFLNTSGMLEFDLSKIPRLSRKYAEQDRSCFISAGTTLISAAGTIGNTVYVRSDMEGMFACGDIMKVIPDHNSVPSGYLYAFLNSCFGMPLVTSGTFGSIILHIEPHHISDLPVPRLGEIEDDIHQLIENSSDCRTKSITLIREAIDDINNLIGFIEEDSELDAPSITIQTSSNLLSRMDSFYYSKMNVRARDAFDRTCDSVGGELLGDVAEVFIPNIFKREYVDTEEYGYPYFTGKQIYELSPQTNQILKKDVSIKNNLILKRGMVVIQDSGQISGIIGRPVIIGEHLNQCTCTNNMVRILANDISDNGYLYALLSSEFGINLLKREASGSSIPHLEVNRIKKIRVPWPSSSERKRIGEKVWESLDLRDKSNVSEFQAISLAENAIKEGGR